MTAKDHTVPRMYLKNFTNNKGALTVHPVNDMAHSFSSSVNNVAAIRGFYWGLGPNGSHGHNMEGLLSVIEDGAAPTLKMLMSDGISQKISWPLLPNPDVVGSCPKTEMSWWIAAQMLRTTRQRSRLQYLVNGMMIEGGKATGFSSANRHLQYIYRHIRSLAYLIYTRPWGFGLSHGPLITSDSPVVMFNGHDNEDQVRAFLATDVAVTLSSDRLLLMPGPDSISPDFNKNDHVFEIDWETSEAINQIIFDSSDQYVFSHPDSSWDGGRLSLDTRIPTPWSGSAISGITVKRKLKVGLRH